ncbi:MAG: RHS repeat-associated core domain-containing protein [Myxococcales bacterium]
MNHTFGVGVVPLIMLALGSALWTSPAGAQADIAPAGTDLRWDLQGRLSATHSGAHAGRYFYADGVGRVLEEHDGSVTYYVRSDFEVRDGIAVAYARVGPLHVARASKSALQSELLADRTPSARPDGRIDVGDGWLASSTAGDRDRAPTEAMRYLYAGARRLLLENSESTAFLHQDHLGSSTLATGAGAQVLAERSSSTTSNAQAYRGFVDDYGFTAQRSDPTTNTQHFPFREFDLRVGRWMSPDPRFLTDGRACLARPFECANGYQYVSNNPVDYVDPRARRGGKHSDNGSAASFVEGPSPRRRPFRMLCWPTPPGSTSFPSKTQMETRGLTLNPSKPSRRTRSTA